MCKVKNWCTKKLLVHWLISLKYYIKDMYFKLGEALDKLHQHSYVWNRLTFLKHRFILWLALQDKLKTRARLPLFGIGIHIACAISGSNPETIDHLLYDCHYSSECCRETLNWVGIRYRTGTPITLLRKFQRCSKGYFRRKVAYNVVVGLVYHIWKARNSSVWNKCAPTIAQMVQGVKTNVKYRIQNLVSKKFNNLDRDWFFSLYFHCCGYCGLVFKPLCFSGVFPCWL